MLKVPLYTTMVALAMASGIALPAVVATTNDELHGAKSSTSIEKTLDATVTHWRQKYSRPIETPYPKDNLYTKERAELGKVLFFDPRLSGSGGMSCASCHNPGFSYGDGLPRALGAGMKPLPRHTPTILNLAWADTLMWDGRADSLESQVLLPMTSAAEMDGSTVQVLHTVSSPEYSDLFAKAYPGESVNINTVTRAIATFERGLVSDPAPFDRWIAGDESAIPEDAKLGFALFNTKANCSKCHSEWNFTDGGFHNVGLKSDDIGRGAHLHLPSMQYAFKTPTLRNVERRAPYMHDGSEKTLEQVIDFYDRGGDMRRASLAPEIVPLHLTLDEKKELVVFLRTLTSADKSMEIPVFPK